MRKNIVPFCKRIPVTFFLALAVKSERCLRRLFNLKKVLLFVKKAKKLGKFFYGTIFCLNLKKSEVGYEWKWQKGTIFYFFEKQDEKEIKLNYDNLLTVLLVIFAIPRQLKGERDI
jgi:hypothetical protein